MELARDALQWCARRFHETNADIPASAWERIYFACDAIDAEIMDWEYGSDVKDWPLIRQAKHDLGAFIERIADDAITPRYINVVNCAKETIERINALQAAIDEQEREFTEEEREREAYRMEPWVSPEAEGAMETEVEDEGVTREMTGDCEEIIDDVSKMGVREAARRRVPLEGADVQALENAITVTERERDKLQSELETLRREKAKWQEHAFEAERVCGELRADKMRLMEAAKRKTD